MLESHDVDAIHPGYGFCQKISNLRNVAKKKALFLLAQKSKHLDMFGDKSKKHVIRATQADIPVIPGTDGPIDSIDEAKEFANQHGYPLMIKAALGGGGRGMRIVRDADSLNESYDRAKSEAKAAFGNDEVYVEKLVENPKHIEVQILGDEQGNVVHLYERDCSMQRRHQKVVEVAPSVSIDEDLRLRICEAAVQLMEKVRYINAGTVEFLVSGNDFYFIEVNPRVQVEHTITEMITGIDIVQSQILIADGYALHSKESVHSCTRSNSRTWICGSISCNDRRSVKQFYAGYR